jgi:transposase
MLKELKNELSELRETLNRQKKFKGDQKLSKANIAQKKDTHKHLQKIVKNLEESEYLVEDLTKDDGRRNVGKHLRFGKNFQYFPKFFIFFHF